MTWLPLAPSFSPDPGRAPAGMASQLSRYHRLVLPTLAGLLSQMVCRGALRGDVPPASSVGAGWLPVAKDRCACSGSAAPKLGQEVQPPRRPLGRTAA